MLSVEEGWVYHVAAHHFVVADNIKCVGYISPTVLISLNVTESLNKLCG